ncbi:flagellar biosynthesis anti-sigma factor FlgM [Vogesella sp. LIG4]|uniref:flagellar biosynthesis anti-sigma factor FlgM n=1 Tax=Vogesella sp. LIG4 TaxID=1192162 RepID=UPI00081FCF6A|nr:flagellar biosynthesis anti-sigma factor FlgM [Vogesella sp. LIG4]SCK07147.1 anti-sigma-28 factor, FlgM family [Vogesella sp. LIG4]
MKIDNSGKVASNYSAPSRTQGKSNTTTERTDGESVAINPFASRLQGMTQAAASAPAFDADKVAAIKSAIASGQFTVHPEAIADSLIASAKELLAG